MAEPVPVRMLWLGRTGYAAARARQLELHAARRRGEIGDTLILTEHEPVITTGRGADFRNLRVDRGRLRELGIEAVTVERGGDITYHGPGQLIAYPILDLRAMGRDVHDYIRRLEESARLLLRELGVNALRRPGDPGLYTAAGKIASVGVYVAGWVTMHGLAINLAVPPEHAGLVQPCGLAGTPFTSVELETMCEVTVAAAIQRYVEAFEEAFARPVVAAPLYA